MPTQLQFRRGNTAQTNAFTGVQAEITVDTEKNLIVVHDGLTAGGFPAAPLAMAQAAFDSANNSAVAGLAFDRANAAFNKANTDQALAGTAFNQANAAFTQANSGITLAQAAFNSANNVAPQVQPAFDKANTAYNAASDAYNFATTANVTANAAFIKANTGVTLAQAAFDSANNVAPQIQPSFDTANAAFTKANNAFSNAGIASTYANTGITLAQAAFDSANNVAPQIQPAFDKANAAFSKANTAANDIITLTATTGAAFNKANSGSTTAQAAFDAANTKLDLNNGGTVNGSVTFTSNVIFSPSSNISFTGNVTSVTITGNTGQFFGYSSNGFNALYVGLPTGYVALPNEVAQFTGANNSYTQINFQNENGGNAATTDWIATANNGTNYNYYVDMGIAGSGYDNSNPDNSLGTVLFPNDSYLYGQGDYNTPSNPGGNLAIGAASTGKVVKIFAGGVNAANIGMTISQSAVTLAKPLVFSDSSQQTVAASPVAYSQAGFAKANSATVTAQAAFDKANTGGVQSVTANSSSRIERSLCS